MTMNRRQALASTAAIALVGWGHARIAVADSPAVSFLDKSNLIYLSPLLADGRESTCHGEVWFVNDGAKIFVVTKADAWRAEALRRGLTAAIWIGEFGVWTSAKEKYRSAPYLVAAGQLETDPALHARILKLFGSKYANEWGKWGPRFRDGLADGSRVMLCYQPVSA